MTFQGVVSSGVVSSYIRVGGGNMCCLLLCDHIGMHYTIGYHEIPLLQVLTHVTIYKLESALLV